VKTKIKKQKNMDNSAVMPSVNKMDDPTPPMPSEPTTPPAKKEHLLVEIAGGVTVAGTMVSALSLWFLMLQFVILPS
jgi:hypothetical protein